MMHNWYNKNGFAVFMEICSKGFLIVFLMILTRCKVLLWREREPLLASVICLSKSIYSKYSSQACFALVTSWRRNRAVERRQNGTFIWDDFGMIWAVGQALTERILALELGTRFGCGTLTVTTSGLVSSFDQQSALEACEDHRTDIERSC